MQKNCDFKSNRKSEAKETETGVLLKAVKENEKNHGRRELWRISSVMVLLK